MPFVLDASAALARAAPDETLSRSVRRRLQADTPLATLDDGLRRAAKKARVKVI